MSLTRREALCRCFQGMGALALADLVAAAEDAPLRPRAPHFRPRARRVLHLFANGGPSQVDTFDPKPMLEKYAGRPLPGENLKTERKTGNAFPSPFRFGRHGRSGLEVSELFPHVAESADDLCVIRSMQTDLPNHEPALMLLNTGEARLVRPSVGSWVAYGLGSENQNLPGFVVLCPGGYPVLESENWRSGFLPGIYQGTHVNSQYTQLGRLIENIRNDRIPGGAQRRQLDLLQGLRRLGPAGDPQLEARIQSFELAFRMQSEATDAFDLATEPESTWKLYGAGTQARQLVLARRLLERGVRFVQVWTGAGQPWDSHEELEENHRKLARECDRPIGALLKDLKRRGLLEDTLVLWGGEFGRTPAVELARPGAVGFQETGRDHNPYGFTVWLAGGGVRGGHVHGATDEFGFKAVDRPVHVHDLHATILHLLGFDHERLTYRYAGRDFRLTDVHGRVVREMLA